MTKSLLTASERQQQLKQVCLRLLARREHSQQELAQKLRLRGFESAEIAAVVTDCAERDWQNEQRFTESFVRQRLTNGYGPLRIRYDLQQRGIKDVDLDAFADQFVDGWQNLLISVYQGKYTADTQLSQQEWLKRCRFLAQRGFSNPMINALRAELKLKLTR